MFGKKQKTETDSTKELSDYYSELMGKAQKNMEDATRFNKMISDANRQSMQSTENTLKKVRKTMGMER